MPETTTEYGGTKPFKISPVFLFIILTPDEIDTPDAITLPVPIIAPSVI